MPFANKVKIVLELAFFPFTFPLLTSHKSLLDFIYQGQLDNDDDSIYLLCASYVPYTSLCTLYELFNSPATL